MRKPERFPAVGNTVDVKTAAYTNSIGSAGTDRRVDRSLIRSHFVRDLLREGARDSHAALVYLLGREA